MSYKLITIQHNVSVLFFKVNLTWLSHTNSYPNQNKVELYR